MAMSKLTGEPVDLSFASQSATPAQGGAKLMRNNTVAGGERMAARRAMLNRLGPRINAADGDQTSGGEENPPPTFTAAKKKRRRSRTRRSSSRASTVVDDREDREVLSTSARNTPLPQQSPAPHLFRGTPEPPRPPSSASRLQAATPSGPLRAYRPTGMQRTTTRRP
ncbi:hypothetical protein NUW54_g13451 [Trametes sanguinea]|uniref:Uncharacterized protein n=1 Tax=Trametes sanguinea TaxID=158606 RepID=A0ACC1ML26_9APHY|nr:hypothetical protein NUW54_g13451 [Trametes sanguinea]